MYIKYRTNRIFEECFFRTKSLTFHEFSIDSTRSLTSFASYSTFVLAIHKRHFPSLALQLLECIVDISDSNCSISILNLCWKACHFSISALSIFMTDSMMGDGCTGQYQLYPTPGVIKSPLDQSISMYR